MTFILYFLLNVAVNFLINFMVIVQTNVQEGLIISALWEITCYGYSKKKKKKVQVVKELRLKSLGIWQSVYKNILCDIFDPFEA